MIWTWFHLFIKDDGLRILPGMYNHIVIAVHFQKINSVCVCVCVCVCLKQQPDAIWCNQIVTTKQITSMPWILGFPISTHFDEVSPILAVCMCVCAPWHAGNWYMSVPQKPLTSAHRSAWRFPKMEGTVPPKHPFVDGISIVNKNTRSKKIPARTCKDTIQTYIHIISYLMLEESLQKLEGQHHPTPQILSSGKPAEYKGDSYNYPKNKWLNHHKSTSTPIIAGSIPVFMLKNLTLGQTGKQIAILVASFLICLPVKSPFLLVKSPSAAVFFDSLPPVAVPSRCEGLAATAAALRWSKPRAPQRKRTLGGQAVVGGWDFHQKIRF